MRFIFEKRMFFLLILTKFPENAHGLPMILEFQGSRIIPQQETSGNYNNFLGLSFSRRIIPQQETSGNYNGREGGNCCEQIIPQQETSGNYNVKGVLASLGLIIPQQETSGNYNTSTAG